MQDAVRRVNGRIARRRLSFAIFFIVAGVIGTVATQAGGFAAFGVGLGLLFLLMMLPPLIRRGEPGSHVHVGPLLEHFNITAEQLSLHVEGERAWPVAPRTPGGIEALRSYVLDDGGRRFSLIRTDETLWVYQYERIERRNGVETSRTNALVFHTTYAPGIQLMFIGDVPDLAAVYPIVCAQAPWAFHGFSAELQAAFADPARRPASSRSSSSSAPRRPRARGADRPLLLLEERDDARHLLRAAGRA